MPVGEFFPDVSGSQWDAGNSGKHWDRHGVSDTEAEQVFFNRPIIADDPRHSAKERRYFALGRTDADRTLTVIFTVRGSLLRVISARPTSRREKGLYGQTRGR